MAHGANEIIFINSPESQILKHILVQPTAAPTVCECNCEWLILVEYHGLF